VGGLLCSNFKEELANGAVGAGRVRKVPDHDGRCVFSVADNSELFIGASRRKGKNQLDR
jgi:hypothetical protein